MEILLVKKKYINNCKDSNIISLFFFIINEYKKVECWIYLLLRTKYLRACDLTTT